ncbi:MAG: DUF4440 domain-containing protein [Deltaproteobacteria bacterium]|nr:DUF4440 domain-containing protein [Deltaproteobacteria bacterium]
MLRSLEEQLLQSDIRRSAAKVGDLLADDFVEFGSSGRVFSKSELTEPLRQEREVHSVQWSIIDFAVRWLAPNIVLATYRLMVRHGSAEWERHTLRSSIWKLRDSNWQMIFHQGTPATP